MRFEEVLELFFSNQKNCVQIYSNLEFSEQKSHITDAISRYNNVDLLNKLGEALSLDLESYTINTLKELLFNELAENKKILSYIGCRIMDAILTRDDMTITTFMKMRDIAIERKAQHQRSTITLIYEDYFENRPYNEIKESYLLNVKRENFDHQLNYFFLVGMIPKPEFQKDLQNTYNQQVEKNYWPGIKLLGPILYKKK